MSLNTTAFEEFAAANSMPSPSDIKTINGLPALQLPGEGLLISEFASQLASLLGKADIYARKGLPFIIDHGAQKLVLLPASSLRTLIEKHVVPFKPIRRTGAQLMEVNCSMSEDTAKAVLASSQFLDGLPVIDRVNPCPMPVMREDNSIELLPIGYDERSHIFTEDPGFVLEEMSLDEARSVLADLLSEFAWPEDNGRSLSVQIAAMLTVFANGILPKGTTCPVFIYMANAEGAGKTLLAILAGIPYREVSAEAAPKDETEWDKKLLALVISGRRLVLLDNIKGHLNSGSFEAYTTSPTYGGRILGASKEFEGEAGATILLTGNHLTITPDLRRRSLLVELFMNQLHAEDRRFGRILDAETIRSMRPRVVSALWSIVKAWDAAGRPVSSQNNSSFPRWGTTIGSMVEFAGYGSPIAPAEIEGMGDTDTADFASLVAAMTTGVEYEFLGIENLAISNGLFDRITSDTDEDGRLKRTAKSKLGYLLKKYNGRLVTESSVFRIEGQGHAKRYSIG